MAITHMRALFILLLITVSAIGHSTKAETLTIVGTGDGTHVLESLAQVFAKTNPTVTIQIPPSIGSSGGIKLVGVGKYKLGRVARKIQGNEIDYGLSYSPYARIPVTFYVHSSVDVDTITIDKILGIYRGSITNWSTVGGKGGKIRAVRREQGDSSFETLNKTIPGFKSLTFSEFVKVATSEHQSVNLVSSTVGAIGFGPLPDNNGPTVKVLALDGIFPTAAGYPLELVLGLIFYEASRTGITDNFISFASSSDAAGAIRDAHALPY